MKSAASGSFKRGDSLLSAIIESTADGILVVDLHGKITHFNQTFARMWGLPAEILESRDDDRAIDFALRQLKHPDKFVKKVKELYAQLESESFDVLEFHDGRVYERYSKPQWQGGHPVGRVWSFRDITERRRFEKERQDYQRTLEKRIEERTAEIRKARDFLNAVVENIPDMIFIKEAKELRFVLFNKAGEKVLGYSRDELIGKNDYDFFSRAEADFFTSRDRVVLETGKLLDIPEEPIHTRAMGKRVLHTKKIPIMDEQGQPEFLLGISEDITERKLSEENQRRLEAEKQARREIERALAMREEFISVAAHEFRTPLTSLKLQVTLMERMLRESEPVRRELPPMFCKLLGDCVEQIEVFTGLVDNLLDVTRMREGKQVITPKETSLGTLVERVVKRYRSRPGEAAAEFSLDLESDVRGWWDPFRIEQVVSNLVTNALKYGGGHPIEVSLSRTGDWATLRVRDHGIGIDPKDHARIFERFERTDASKCFWGFGLGLFISRQVVLAHGGFIRVESEPGRGACFIVELPLRQAPAAQAV